MSAYNPKVGKLRPSQVVTQHGPGAVVDLPDLSVIVAGINHWYPTPADLVPEPRLQAFLRVKHLYRPPQPAKEKFGGVPAFMFPEWLVCPRCRYLAHWTKFSPVYGFSFANFRCPRTGHPAHGSGGKSPDAFPARFMVACPRGHLDDFPWEAWVHRGADAPCSSQLELIDTGSSGSANDLMVKCTSCDSSRRLGDAFSGTAHSSCSGRQPWLGPNDRESCTETARTILRGASNAYFSVVASALSVPPWSDPIHQEIAPYLDVILDQAKSKEQLHAGVKAGFYDLGDLVERHSLDDIWAAATSEAEVEPDLRRREWLALTFPDTASHPGTEFEVKRQAVPPVAAGRVDLVVAGLRLREVRALRGFTRLDSSPELGDELDVSELNVTMAPIGKEKKPSWLPAIDLRGEGIFVRLDEEALSKWESTAPVVNESERRASQWQAWLAEHGRDEQPFRGMRYVLLHTLAHALIRQLSLESGYSASALRERIYCDTGDRPMAGLLIYTASSDSDGSLGGLVDQAKPDRLGPLLMDALQESGHCSQDPLCGGQDLGGHAHMNGAACHACMLLAETSCEFGNRLLDRATLYPTIGNRGIEFFDG